MRILKSLILAAILSVAAAVGVASCSDEDADTNPPCAADGTCPMRYQCNAKKRCEFIGGPLPDAAVPDSRPADARPDGGPADAAAADAAAADAGEADAA